MSREYSFTGIEDAVVASDRVLYTPSAFARSHLLYLQEVGHLQARKPHTNQRKGLHSYLFFLVREGRGTFSYENREYALEKGDCVFVDCRDPYFHRTDPKDLWSLAWIHFDGSSMQGIYSQYKERGGRPCFRPQEVGPFLEIYENIYHGAAAGDTAGELVLNAHISSLLALLLDGAWNVERGVRIRQRRDLTPIRQYLEEHYREKIGLEDLAARFYINKFYLTKAFRDQFGLSIGSYLLGLRVTRAKHQLRFSHDKLEAIGLDCGLGSLSYFSRTFKKAEGMSPGEYREKWQG